MGDIAAACGLGIVRLPSHQFARDIMPFADKYCVTGGQEFGQLSFRTGDQYQFLIGTKFPFVQMPPVRIDDMVDRIRIGIDAGQVIAEDLQPLAVEMLYRRTQYVQPGRKMILHPAARYAGPLGDDTHGNFGIGHFGQTIDRRVQHLSP